MTQLHQRNLPRHGVLARQLVPLVSSSVAPSTPASLKPTPHPSPSSDPSINTRTSSSSVQSTTEAPPSPVVKTSTTSVSTSTSAPISKTSSTTTSSTTTSSTTIDSSTTSSSTTSSTVRSTSSVPKPTTISTPVHPIVDTNQLTSTSSTDDLTPTPTDSLGTTPSATAAVGSNLSAGPIVGAVAGTLIGLVLLGFLIAFFLRRYRQSRRRAMRDSDFGTFRHSLFAPLSTPTHPHMVETDHNAASSLNEPYISYPAATAQPPSQALAAATTAGVAATAAASDGGLQERPKYVYGQDPSHAYQQWQLDDIASDIAHGGAYSSQPQVQNAYNTEAYGSYAKYDDVGNGVVGGVPAGTVMYQDAQRAYQGQQGYDQSQSQYVEYGQQHPYAAYDHSRQHQAYAMGSNNAGAGAHADAYGGI